MQRSPSVPPSSRNSKVDRTAARPSQKPDPWSPTSQPQPSCRSSDLGARHPARDGAGAGDHRVALFSGRRRGEGDVDVGDDPGRHTDPRRPSAAGVVRRRSAPGCLRRARSPRPPPSPTDPPAPRSWSRGSPRPNRPARPRSGCPRRPVPTARKPRSSVADRDPGGLPPTSAPISSSVTSVDLTGSDVARATAKVANSCNILRQIVQHRTICV